MKKSELIDIIRREARELLFDKETLEEAGGQDRGQLEIETTSLDDAIAYAKKHGIYEDIPDFDTNYMIAKNLASYGSERRKDMPVITDDDVMEFQRRLKSGTVDVRKPFADTTDMTDPFPEGLSGFEASDFLERGLKDGAKNDDKIQLTIKQVAIKDLKPIQKQIYLSKPIEDGIKKFGIESTKKFYQGKTFFITSSDNFIIDGHHRWLGGLLIDPNMKVNCLSIDLPISKLLPLAKAYGDAVGNQRNESRLLFKNLI